MNNTIQYLVCFCLINSLLHRITVDLLLSGSNLTRALVASLLVSCRALVHIFSRYCVNPENPPGASRRTGASFEKTSQVYVLNDFFV